MKNRIILLVFFYALLFSCKHTKKESIKETAANQQIGRIITDSFEPTTVINIVEVKPPVIIKASMPKRLPLKYANGLNVPSIAHFTLTNGLPSNGLVTASVDPDGNMWYATNGFGICKYDGQRFTKYTEQNGLVSNKANGIFASTNHDVWIPFGKGVGHFNGKYFSVPEMDKAISNDSIHLNAIFEDAQGTMWFGTNSLGLFSYKNGVFKRYTTDDGLSDNAISRVAQDKKGNLYVSTASGIDRYNGKSFEPFKVLNASGSYPLLLLGDSKGGLWFSDSLKFLARYDGITTKVFTKEDGLETRIGRMREDHDGNYWMGGDRNELIRFDGKHFIQYGIKDGFLNRYWNSLTKDRQGNIWAVAENGVDKLTGNYLNKVEAYEKGNSQSFWLENNYCFDQTGNIWQASPTGLAKYQEDHIDFFTEETIFNSKNIGCNFFIDRASNCWFTLTTDFEDEIRSKFALIKFDGVNFTVFGKEQGFLKKGIVTISDGEDGSIWLADDQGIAKFDGNTFTYFDNSQGIAFGESTILFLARRVFQDSKNRIWTGSGLGAYVIDGHQLKLYTKADGLADNYVNNFTEDPNGNIWLSTNGGTSKFDGNRFYNYSSLNGLYNTIRNLKYDTATSTLWFTTSIGLASLNKEELNKETPLFIHYNPKFGFNTKEAWVGSLFIDKKGNPFWISEDTVSSSQIASLDFTSIKENKPLPLRINNIKLNGKEVSWKIVELQNKKASTTDSLIVLNETALKFNKAFSANETTMMQKEFDGVRFDSLDGSDFIPINLTIPLQNNNILFEFSSVSPQFAKYSRYQYFLVGYDRNWSTLSTKSEADFGNIREGDYTFRVKALDALGHWNETSYAFTVLPPWYRTTWFRIIMGITLVLFLYGIYRWRTATLRKQKRVLEQTVRERTAELVEEKAEVEKQKVKSDELLLNILPAEVAEELKEKGYTTAKSFDNITILFSDIVGFTNASEKLTAEELVKEIDNYFSAFDRIMQRYGIEKIKTIGDAYIAAGGLTEHGITPANSVVEASIAMRDLVEEFKKERINKNKPYFELRIGINTGPIVAGVAGIKKFQYDIWGDTVNMAARMEQAGVPGKINISQFTYERIKDQFNCTYRGKIEAKNKGEVDMYFVD